MNLTYEIINDELSDQLDCTLYGSKLNEQQYISSAIYEPGMSVNNNYIYICSGIPYDLADKPGLSLFIICDEAINDVSGEIMKHQNYIAFSEAQPLVKIANIVFNIFTKLNYWYEQLNVEVGKPGFIDNLLELTFPLLGNTLILVDADLRPISKYDSQTGIVDVKAMESSDQFMVKVRDEYLKTRNCRDVIHGELKGDYQRLIYNLFDGNSLVGILSLQADARPLKPSDSDIFKVLGDYIAVIFQHLGSKYMPHVSQLCEALSIIIHDSNTTQMQRNAVNHFANISGITKDEEFQVMVINGTGYHEDRYLAYFMHSLSTKIPGMVLTNDDTNTAVFIIRRSYAESAGIDVDSILLEYLKEYNFYAALSDSYQDLSATKPYYLQACVVLRLSVESGSPDFLNRFSDYYVEYLVSKITAEIPAQNLYSAGFRKILKLDQGSKISYIETLRAYMMNHLSATKTANALYISRNAFMYRLDKIFAILEECGEDLSDRDDFFRIQMSFFLYDHFGFRS